MIAQKRKKKLVSFSFVDFYCLANTDMYPSIPPPPPKNKKNQFNIQEQNKPKVFIIMICIV